MASTGSNSTTTSFIITNSEALKATLDWNKHSSMPILRDFLRQQSGSLTEVDVQGNTIVHFLARSGRASALRELLEDGLLTSHQQLMQVNLRGDTALHEAARFGQRNAAEIMLTKNPNLASSRNDLGETPLYVAAACGKREVFNLLRVHVGLGDLIRRNDGGTILHAAVLGEHYNLALEILELYPHLARAQDETGATALNLLANKPGSFRSGSLYSLENLGSRPFVPLQFIRCLAYLCIPSVAKLPTAAGDVEDPRQHGVLSQPKSFVRKLISGYRWIIRAVICCPSGVADIKQHHAFALLLAKRLILLEEDWSHYTYGDCLPKLRKHQLVPTKDQLQVCNEGSTILESAAVTGRDSRMINRIIQNPLIQAVKHGIHELVEEIIRKFPDAAFFVDKDGKNILHLVVECKDRKLYDYLKPKVHKDEMLAAMDNRGNTVLHLATLEGSSPSIIHGHMNQMAWDVCWFKRICYDAPPHFLYHRNADGKTAREMFEESHSGLREKAEKTIKDMNNALMLVAALVGTVNYATIFTIPGGFVDDPNSKNFGRPSLFSTRDGCGCDLRWFLGFTGLALFSSLFSLATMVLIQLSRFCSDDFYLSLPFKFLAALFALFFSALATILACVKAYKIIDLEVNPNVFMWPAISMLTLLGIDTLWPTVEYILYAFCCAFSSKSMQTRLQL
ncbi:uncharacterized protein LOC127789715 [Diospyros lotus]|uniref:uncharacterized protein LOC127789715 n=1 Tax=Diospyros lotus TaxID=55363 RepID=UPI00225C2303|nr:uncharacterized protein LOC127789715 [Diospyros lotus]